MCSRSAVASIKGYSYQFLHTILDILNQEDSNINTIEGIENLDIYSGDINKLCQYKYHELKHYTNSLVGKPIGLMYNHFLNNMESNYNYHLVIYVNKTLPIFNVKRIHKILMLSSHELILISSTSY
jgi:hypothetical protein